MSCLVDTKINDFASFCMFLYLLFIWLVTEHKMMPFKINSGTWDSPYLSFVYTESILYSTVLQLNSDLQYSTCKVFLLENIVKDLFFKNYCTKKIDFCIIQSAGMNF
jgi:hypothetical protein